MSTFVFARASVERVTLQETHVRFHDLDTSSEAVIRFLTIVRARLDPKPLGLVTNVTFVESGIEVKHAAKRIQPNGIARHLRIAARQTGMRLTMTVTA